MQSEMQRIYTHQTHGALCSPPHPSHLTPTTWRSPYDITGFMICAPVKVDPTPGNPQDSDRDTFGHQHNQRWFVWHMSILSGFRILPIYFAFVLSIFMLRPEQLWKCFKVFKACSREIISLRIRVMSSAMQK